MTWQDEWLELILKDSGYLSIDRIARSSGVEEDELRQTVAIWWHLEADELADTFNAHGERIVVKMINNQAKKLAQKLQAEKWEATGQYFYTKDFVRKNKQHLANAFGSYTLASDAHAVYCDFDKAFSSLTYEEQQVFLTCPDDYPPDEKENQRFRARVSKLTTRVHRLMNNEAATRERSIEHVA